MTISLNWLKDYLDIDLPPDEIAELLTSLGLEVEGMETVEPVKGGLAGVVTGQVLETWKHPNADRLTLTRVDVGNGQVLQIVCGAPNVAAGQKVLVALPGTTLYPTEGEPIQLKKGKIRGELSEGMICAEDELGLGTDHSGIMVLPEDTPVGLPAAEYFHFERDTVFEIGLTPNRTDAMCHLGVARDLAAALRWRHKLPLEVKVPSVEAFNAPQENPYGVQVIVEHVEACPRYAGIAIEGVQVGPSPDWLQNRLRTIGVRPINNVVDVTNFILHELGQPLHAFDLDAIAGHTIRVKTLPEGTPFVTLDGQERRLSAEDLMICDGNSKPMCIGGVFGGLDSGVKEHTTRIFLESAHFNPRFIRRTSARHKLRTDAAQVFEKGSDPQICLYALQRAALMLCELAGGRLASPVFDVYPKPVEPAHVRTSWEYVNRLIGTELKREEVLQILEALEMPVLQTDEEGFTVAVPTNKADVTRPADVVEEILRIYGLDNVPVPAQMRISPVHNPYPDDNQLRQAAATYLAANGFYEIMSMSLSRAPLYTEVMGMPAERLVRIHNTSNATLDVLRPTLLFSGLEAIAHNIAHGQPDLKLFEFGKSYHPIGKPTDQPNGDVTQYFSEPQHLALFLTGGRWPESWRIAQKPAPHADFYTLKAHVENLLKRMGVNGWQQSEADPEVFLYGLRYHRGTQNLVSFGKVQPALAKAVDVKSEVFFADIDWDAVAKAARQLNVTYVEPSRYPSVRRDLALLIDQGVRYADLEAAARKAEKQLLRQVNLFDVFEDEKKLGKGKKSYAMSFVFQHPERTLQDAEVDAIIEKFIRIFEEKFGAQVRR